MTDTTPARRSMRLTLAALSVAAATSISGCIEEDQLSAAIDSVAMKMESLGAPGTAVPGQQLRERTYTEAIGTLKPLVGDGTADQKSAAWLLIARAEFGLAADPIAQAAETRREASDAVRSIRGELSAYRELAALVAAAESFDPSDEIAEIQTRISERAAEAREVQAEMDEVQKQIAALESLEQQAREASNEFRNAEADLRAQAMSLSAQEALPLTKQAAEQRSRADDLAADADRRAAEADVLRPQITEYQGEIDRLAQQQLLLEESIESLNAQRETTAQEASQFRTRADEIGSRINEAIRSADAYRAGPMNQAHSATYDALETAAASAGKGSASRTTSKLLSAEISHALGGTALAQAASVEALLAIVNEAISDAGMTGGSLSSTASALQTESEALRVRAADALRTARDDFEAAGVRGENADRVDNIVASINTMLGEEPDLGEADDDTGFDDNQPPADAAEPSDDGE